MNDEENNESELVDIRVAAEMGQVTRKLSLSRRQRIQQQRLRERVHKKAGKQVFGKRRLSSSDSITFRDRKYNVIGISDNNESIGDKPYLAHNMLNNNVIDEDSDIEVDQWLLQKRNSVRLERRPTAIFDMEKSAIQASIQLKVQQERRRMKHKEKIKLRLENRGYEDLLASSEDEEEVNLDTPDVFLTSSEDEGIQQRETGEGSINKGNFTINEEDGVQVTETGAITTVRVHKFKHGKLRRKFKPKNKKIKPKELEASSFEAPEMEIGFKKKLRSKKSRKRKDRRKKES